MQSIELIDALILAAMFLAAGAVKGICGMALPAVSLGLMTFIYEPRIAVAVLIPAVVYTNFRQMRGAVPIKELVYEYRWLLGISAVVLFLAALVGGQVPSNFLFICVGVAMIIFAISGLMDRVPRLNPEHETRVQVLTGVVAGVLGGLTSIWGPAIVAFLTSKRLEKELMIQSLGLLLMSQALFLTVGLLASGELTLQLALIGAAMILPAHFGMVIGERVRSGFNQAQFTRVLLIVFLILGVNLMRRGIFT